MYLQFQKEGIFMFRKIKNMVKEKGVRNTLDYLINEDFSDTQLNDLEEHHILNHGIPSLSLLYSFEE